MLPTRGYAAQSPTSPLAPFSFERREVGPRDVLIEIDYCGICHSDIHQARDEWGGSIFPMVPGHEIVGRVLRVGDEAHGFIHGDLVGVGCFVDSCRTCPSCQAGHESYCEGHLCLTYNGREKDGVTPTYGGYSNQIVVDRDFVLRVPENLELSGVAPLLCAGITTWSPLRHWRVGPGTRLGVLGLGGLGHMAVKLGAALGAEVTVFSHTPGKKDDAHRLGAHNFVLMNDDTKMKGAGGTEDLIIDTVSAPHDLPHMLHLLKHDGTLVLVGAPPTPLALPAMSLIMRRRRVAGSLVGGIRETQEMLDFCGEHGIVSDVEVISMAQVNEAYERVLKSDVRYRFVLDMKTL